MTEHSDHDLQRLFADLRASDMRSAPAFARVASRPLAKPRHTRWPALVGSVALLALVAVWRITSNPRDVSFVIRPGEMRVPTDYLMDLVSVARAGEIPRIGVVDWFPLEPATDNRRPQ